MVTTDLKVDPNRILGRPKITADYVPARVALLEATIKLVAIQGTTDVTAKQVCDFADAKTSSVNHNFGSWNGLIAEAAMVAYERFAEKLWLQTNNAGQDPEARLRAYAFEHMAWHRDNPGWGAMFNYPFSAKAATAILNERHGERFKKVFLLNKMRWGQLVFDLRDGIYRGIEFDVENLPVQEVLANRSVVFRSIVELWAVSGMSVWASKGASLETRIPVITELQDEIMQFCVDEVVRAIKSDRAPLAGQ